MELSSYHPPDTWNLEVACRILENLWTAVYGVHVPYDLIYIDVVLEM